MMRLQLSSSPTDPAASSAAAAAAQGPVMAPSSYRTLGGAGAADGNESSNDLMGNSLASYFSQLFEKAPPEPQEAARRREKKSKKPKAAAKNKDRRKVEPLAELYPTLPEVSLPRTPSSFAVFAAVRATCLESRQRQAALMQLQSAAAWKEIEASTATDQTTVGDDSAVSSPDEPRKLALPKMVGIGLNGVFEIIRESHVAFPSICRRALESLLNIVQGLQPEDLSREPTTVTEPMFQTLLDLASLNTSDSTADRGNHVRALSCACLLSFATALGDTGKLLRASSTMLMSPRGSERIVMPAILVSLQRSIISVMLGKTDHPDVMNHGVLSSSALDCFKVNYGQSRTSAATAPPNKVYSMASDGTYIFLHTSSGLFKVGSGYGGTVKGRIYRHRPEFESGRGWIGFVRDSLLFRPYSCGEEAEKPKFEVFQVDRNDLLVTNVLTASDCTFANFPHVLFSDGVSLGVVVAGDRSSRGGGGGAGENFYIRFLSNKSSSNKSVLSCVLELPLKLARKCVVVFGASVFDDRWKKHEIEFGFDDEAVSLMTGKDFALMQSNQGKLYYSGKSASIGHKQPCPTGQWNEVNITRSPKISQCSIGHEGQHALILTVEGVVYFTGTARRGEDGDQSKNRRQPKPVKPKKMLKFDGIPIAQVACNNGTSALVGKDGGLYILGKDATHTDYATGQVTELKGTHITQVSVGKAHIVALSKSGEVFSFGMNNKGQCGRDFPAATTGKEANIPNADNEASGVSTSNDADGETCSDTEGEGFYSICGRGKHSWKHDQCMVCVLCGECTGYGSSCVSSCRPDRNPGTLCGCGSGDSGCADCGVCMTCAWDEKDVVEVSLDLPNEAAAAAAYAAGAAGAAGGEVAGGGKGPMDIFAAVFAQEAQDYRAKHKARILAAQERRYYKRKLIQRSIQKIRNGGRGRRHTEKEERDSRRGGGVSAEAQPPEHLGVKSAELRNRERNLASTLGQASASDVEKEAGKLASLSPAKISLAKDVKIVQLSSGLHHTLMLSSRGDVYAFGSNSYGQLGLCDLVPRGAPTKVPLPVRGVAVAAGSNHSVVLGESGEVFTFGSHQKGQLGRTSPLPEEESHACAAEELAARELWFAHPDTVADIGPSHGRLATWVGASADQTFIKADESLINAQNLTQATVMANSRNIVVLSTAVGKDESSSEAPTQRCHQPNFSSMVISRSDGFCRSFSGPEQEHFAGKVATMDTVYNVLWSYDNAERSLHSYMPIVAELKDKNEFGTSILAPEMALPVSPGSLVSRNQASLNLLSCLDVLCQLPEVSLTSLEEEQGKGGPSKAYTKEDFSVVNRFESHGGGWGYSGHSIEAIRFMTDTDILLGGYGLFGGRGEYMGKIKLFDIGPDGGDQETDGELLAESEEVTYECGARQKFPILFDDPIPLSAGRWYIAWARVSGPSSDCGSSGQTQVTTEDQIVFNFKSSKRSNNGTDVNAGQVPQLLYRAVASESSQSSQRHRLSSDLQEPVCVLTTRFARTVSDECIGALIGLIQWSWNAFKAGSAELLGEEDENNAQAVILDLERLCFICRSCLRLMVIYTLEVYPAKISPNQARPIPETQKLAEAIFDCRTLLQQILKDPLKALNAIPPTTSHQEGVVSCRQMTAHILADAHKAFVSCFHAYYPSGYLKWSCLCNLLALMDDSTGSVRKREDADHDRLLTAVLDALCSPLVMLRNTFPITYSPETETSRGKNLSPAENLSLTTSMIQAGEGGCSLDGGVSAAQRFPILNELMNYQGHLEGIRFGSWSFREVLDRLLAIASLPVRQALKGEQRAFSKELEEKSCQVISAVISELANQRVSNEADLQSLGGRILHMTPNRFTRTSNSRTWNTGNGSPDAICFSVDKPGIFLVGCTVFGGMGTYDFELELLDDQSNAGMSDRDRLQQQQQSQRWNSLEIAHGSYTSEDCVGDIAELKFEKAVALRPHVKYALRLRNHGGRTSNGDGGVSSVRGPDGTTFTFSSCSLSFNGTNPTRGQLPQLLYFSSPSSQQQGGASDSSATKSLAEIYARRTALNMTATIVKTATNLLVAARDFVDDEKGLEVLNCAPIVTKLLPHVFASVANLTRSDPHSAVQIVGFIQNLLPSVAALNNLATLQKEAMGEEEDEEDEDVDLPSPHYAWVESDHPYKSASVANYKVVFPPSVQWMSIEFDPRCATGQMEDVLQIYIRSPTNARSQTVNKTTISSPTDPHPPSVSQMYNPVLKRFSGTSNWPDQAIILPGNEVLFSLETASDYVKDEKTNEFGFRCLVVGYEPVGVQGRGLRNLEMELAYLGGLCAASLMRRNLALPNATSNGDEMEAATVEEAAADAYDMHPALLSKGFALDQPPSVQMALGGVTPFSSHSNERSFLRNFVRCAVGTSGGRLAKWLQPESYVDVDKCLAFLDSEDMRCNWPTIITVVTRDQYGEVVQAPNMRVEVRAIPVDEMNQSGSSKLRKASSAPDAMTYGGHRPPNLEPKYEVTVKDKMFYHAITIQKCYDNYSFEELRFAAPVVQRQSENMLVRANSDGTYSANWTPGNVGGYKIHVTIDGFDMTESFRVEVKDPPQGVAPPSQGSSKKTPGVDYSQRLRKFIARPSAGLRIRVHPTLQSEQIGVLPVDGVVAIVDEMQNADGVWVRLANKTMADLAINYSEGWCLQYNQHLEKTLLVPVVNSETSAKPDKRDQRPQPTNHRNNIRLPSTSPFQPEPIIARLPMTSKAGDRRKRLSVQGPGQYTVVKCGASGHNVRSKPNLMAAPVGMLNLGDHFGVVQVKEDSSSGEIWVQLDQESSERHCFSSDGDAWSLAISATDMQYLENEETEELNDERFAAAAASFDPSVVAAPTMRPETFVRRSGESMRSLSTAPSIQEPPAGARPRAPSSYEAANVKAWGVRQSSPVHFDFGGVSAPSANHCSPKPTPPPRKNIAGAAAAAVKRESSLSPSRRTPSPSDGRKPSLFKKLFGGEKAGSSSPPLIRKWTPPPINKDIPPELQGVSVKELVKVIGESRANGNGVTPPGTPNSLRKVSSRSTSPQITTSRSSSPIAIRGSQATGGNAAGVASKSPLSRSPASCNSGEAVNLQRRDSSQSDTSALVSSITRDLSQSPGSVRDETSASPSLSMKSESSRHQHRRSSPKLDRKSQLTETLESAGEDANVSLRNTDETFTGNAEESPGMSGKSSYSTTVRTSASRTVIIPEQRHFQQEQHFFFPSGNFAPADLVLPDGPVKEAMSPSVAESLRSVFAAFVWHEGIVHDAMAVASYLKFHPSLSKDGQNSAKQQQHGAKKDPKNKKNQRHSVEVISTAYLQSKLDYQIKSAINANTNRNLAMAAQPEAIAEESLNHGQVENLPDLPLTIRLLVMLWEEVKSYCRHAIMQQVILASPLHQVPSRKSESRRDRERKVKRAKRKVGGSNNSNYGKEPGVAWPMNRVVTEVEEAEALYAAMVGMIPAAGGAAAVAPTSEGAKDAFYQLCDICGHHFQHPVTYHIRLAHPGCGKPADGKGYNSGGNYCGGWAGNCGDGGVGGSSWYLLCEKCRSEHIKGARPQPQVAAGAGAGAAAISDAKTSQKDLDIVSKYVSGKISSAMAAAFQSKQLRRKSTMPMPAASKLSSPTGTLNSHIIMNNNAMFLLDLASASNSNLVPPTTRQSKQHQAYTTWGARVKSNLSAVDELSPFDPNPFPLVPFQCFNSLGIRSSRLKLLNRELILDDALKNEEKVGNLENFGRCSDEISPPAQFRTTDEDKENKNTSSSPSKRPFCRSISVGSSPGTSQWSQEMPADLEGPSEAKSNKGRKRNSSYEDSPQQQAESEGQRDSNDFMSNPSPALQKLFGGGNVMADILQRPVMSFVLQWNDLDSLRVAMTVALRKAACRTFAMQALNWLLRSVSQLHCLHDLLWCFVAALEATGDPLVTGCNDGGLNSSMVECNRTKEKKNRKNAVAQQQQPGAGGILAKFAASGKDKHLQQQPELCEHPTSDIYIAGEAIHPMPETFHSLLQTVSDLMLLLPVGSSLQQIAIRCWGIKFKPTDHQFLHQSHVFSTISRILSRSEELDSSTCAANNVSFSDPVGGLVEKISDISSGVELKVSSRQAMLASLSDNSTETFWESGDEDRNKTKWIALTLPAGSRLRFRNVSVHVDNGRDLGNKVSSVIFKSGKTLENVNTVKQADVESRYSGWVCCFLAPSDHNVVKIELKGPDNTLRVRQVKVLGSLRDEEEKNSFVAGKARARNEICSIQQSNCEAETLRVFRLITGQVFGKLLEESEDATVRADDEWAQENYLKEHVVGILFSRSKLTYLQKQVCAHIVQSIKKEASRFREEWEASLCSGAAASPAPASAAADMANPQQDIYCFEMLSLVLALSGSAVGRTYLAQQLNLVKDLLSLLHTGSGRIQRQVIALLRRMLPKVPPVAFAGLLGISNLPPKDFGILTSSSTDREDGGTFNMFKTGILDIFLSCISKALTLQVKSKSKKEGKTVSVVSLASSIHPHEDVGDRWWLRGSMSKKVAEEIIHLLKDLTSGQLSEEWAVIAKSAIAENILNLTRLDGRRRDSVECLKHPVIWLALASLCVLDKDHVEGLTSGEWGQGETAAPRPTCDNHDDGETLAIIKCDVCGNLCADCDRFLHLHRRTREHQRQVFKEEEEAIKVDLHEGCGRTKLFWVLALADSLTLKAMVEFRDGGRRGGGGGAENSAAGGATSSMSRSRSAAGNLGICRFCGRQSSADSPVMDSVCTDRECVEYSKQACEKVLACGHFCGGIAGESVCMPCLHGCSGAKMKQDADDMCMICFTEALSPVPSILLRCGHIFHYGCCATVLEKRWLGPRITFGFRNCPICKARIDHESLAQLLEPIDRLYEDVRKKALMRLEYEGLSKCEAVTAPGARYYGDPAGFALERYAYYVCAKCGRAYYGGEAACDADVGRADPDDFNPEELVCGGCSDVSRAQMCAKHGTDYLEYKCRYCCSVAVFFCFGTTHFCQPCHDDFQRVANLPKSELPQCPVGPKCTQLQEEECPLHVKHPPTGEEFALGCGICRNAHTF